MPMKIHTEAQKDGRWWLDKVNSYKTSEAALRWLRRKMDMVRLSDREATRFQLYNSRGDKVLTVTWTDWCGWQDRGSWA